MSFKGEGVVEPVQLAIGIALPYGLAAQFNNKDFVVWVEKGFDQLKDVIWLMTRIDDPRRLREFVPEGSGDFFEAVQKKIHVLA
ncbi:hypothetical protein HYN46_01385 [Aquirhabdus parva]|uniref:Uncharacterized protein n=1 Tax=Aquirhabdus parva TaxID=2283318 RepID=A0A345P303_9GAMM|nr:hypothetical protein HYN46_01385 [Aquirhabdus parva]